MSNNRLRLCEKLAAKTSRKINASPWIGRFSATLYCYNPGRWIAKATPSTVIVESLIQRREAQQFAAAEPHATRG